MGVKGLNYLVESHNLEEEEEKNGGNLRSLKETLLRRDPTRSPTLVFDMWNFAHSAFAGVDWVTGGRPAIIFHQLGEFIANLEGAGIHPVFVIDGINPVVKIDVFVSRKQSRARDMKKVFDALRNGKGLTQDVYQKSILTENLRDMLRRLGADFHCSLGDSDQLTAQVAEDRRAFGIVSDDSDFLIFPSHPSLRVISASGLNMESLRFKKMRRPAALAHFLDLPLARLPLWATLFGSDLAKGIHAIHHLRGQAHLSADETRRIDLTQDILPQLTTSWKEEEERTLQEVLGTYRIRKRDENNNDEKKVPASDFMVYWRQKMDQVPGIDRQAPGYPKWCRTLERVGEMFERGLLESICSVVLGMHYALPSAALDYSGSPGLPFLEDFTDRIRRSIFGILLLETNKIKADPSQELLVDEWIVTKENPYNFTRDTLQCRTRPLWPEEDVDYFQILNEDHLGLKELRMNLFGRAIDPQLDSTVLSRLEPSSVHLFSKLYMLGNCLEVRTGSNNIRMQQRRHLIAV